MGVPPGEPPQASGSSKIGSSPGTAPPRRVHSQKYIHDLDLLRGFIKAACQRL